MAPLATHADQAVRHAVDAYIDGRSLPTFEGDARFETRNSAYRLLDGVLLSAPDASLVGAELVGWLVEFPSRSEVTSTWRNGARAVLVDTRNDGVRGPHIVVTSATRAYRSDRQGSTPRMAQNAGSGWPQGGSSMSQSWDQYPAPVAPPAPVSPSWGLYPVAAPPPAPVPARAKTLPPPPVPPQRPAPVPPPYVVRPATPVPPPPRPLPRPLPPPPAVPHDLSPASYEDHRRGPSRLSQGSTRSAAYGDPAHALPSAADHAARSRAHQRGLPLR